MHTEFEIFHQVFFNINATSWNDEAGMDQIRRRCFQETANVLQRQKIELLALEILWFKMSDSSTVEKKEEIHSRTYNEYFRRS